MTPRIRRRFGIWYCGLLTPSGVLWPPYGEGYRPDDALRDWLAIYSTREATA